MSKSKSKSTKHIPAPKTAATGADKNTIQICDKKWQLVIARPMDTEDGTAPLTEIRAGNTMVISPEVHPDERPMAAIRLFFKVLRLEGALTYAASSSQGNEVNANLDDYDGYQMLRDCILDNCHCDDPLRREVRSIVETGEAGFDLKDLVEDMGELIKTFTALPAKRRKEIANGWVLPRSVVQWDRSIVHEALIGNEVRSVYQVNGGRGADEPMDGGFSWEFNSSGQPIRITFRPGMRKMEVVKGIRDMANRLERQWEAMIANPEGRDVDELIAADLERAN
jgi:hypothetical protein